ncbi:hypothetical protein FQN54_009315 [Arachnomyces sp. PD_36]|nr:hypothetical protein FQN54_009315 [Arachnomyces sp. PD_36]
MATDSSHDDPDKSGAPFTWILEHIMAYPGTYDIPLRTMYALNSNPKAQLSTDTADARRAQKGNALSKGASPAQDNADDAAQFKANLMSQVAQLPSQPGSLPISFTTSFVRRCFPLDVEDVDFPQALTALDYLKDIENRRRKDVFAALKRLGIDKQKASDRDELAKTFPGVMTWILALEEKEKTLEALYAQVYVGVRRWLLINEMLWEPFHKANCLAMLNTLYPPINPPQFTPHINDAILSAHRHGFSQYIFAIEREGRSVLDTIIKQGARAGEENGWPSVRETIDKYLTLANAVMDDCMEVNGKDSLEGEELMRKTRKVDSGVSFTSSEGRSFSGDSSRGSTRSSINSATKVSSKHATPPDGVKKSKSGGSTMERIAKEIRKISSRADIRDSGDSGFSKSKGLKKMRSVGFLGGDKKKGSGGSASDPPPFDVDEFKRKRLIWEAQNAKKAAQAKRGSNESGSKGF